MDKKWRPEGWENKYKTRGGLILDISIVPHIAFEFGADAMLEALLAKGTPAGHVGKETVTCMTIHAGTWVFIPDKV